MSKPQLLAFRALANPARYEIVETLTQDGLEHPCQEFIARLGVTPPAVSNHLRMLEEARLISLRRSGTQLYVSLATTDVAYQTAAMIRGNSRQPN
ncbi:MAG TPA: metalloregulator ArsR/SmtB family transcription factor [Dehalococcoidia bacterium]|nr:metalloregulator ArsR/SmtB family transcription factor [Dehalococcoidia bacterium]